MSPVISRAARALIAISSPWIGGAWRGSSNDCSFLAAFMSCCMRCSRWFNSSYNRAFSTELAICGASRLSMPHMIVGEVRHALAFEIHDADHAILRRQGNRNFRANLGMRRDIARIGERIVDADRFAGLGRGAGDAFAERDVVQLHALVIPHAEPVPQHGAVRVEQHDAERVVVDQRANRLRDFSEQFIEIENRAELLRQMREHSQRSIRAIHPPVQSRVVDRNGDPACDQAQQRAVVLGVGSVRVACTSITPTSLPRAIIGTASSLRTASSALM